MNNLKNSQLSKPAYVVVKHISTIVFGSEGASTTPTNLNGPFTASNFGLIDRPVTSTQSQKSQRLFND